jgi:hypothetical protein
MFTCSFIKGRRRLALALSVATAALAACGGGEDGTTVVPDEEYQSWSSSVNGVVIRDANNDSFAVRRDNRTMAEYYSDTQLTGLTVDSAANIWNRGTVVGTVVYATSTQGNRITSLQCLNGRSMDITFSGTSWSYTC